MIDLNEQLIEKLMGLSDDELFGKLKKDYLLKSAIHALVNNFSIAGKPDWRKGFESWDYETFEKWEADDRATIVHWARMGLGRQLDLLRDPELRAKRQKVLDEMAEHKRKVEAEADQKFQELKIRERNMLSTSIPKLYAKAELEDFPGSSQKQLITNILHGYSYILYGGRGIGKTHLGWAVTKAFIKKDKFPYFKKAVELKLEIEALASGARSRNPDQEFFTQVLNRRYVEGFDLMMVDEVDKGILGDSAFQHFLYLMDRRYEEQKQTILFCNSENWDELTKSVGSSLVSRFGDKRWHAQVLNLGKADKRPKEEVVAND